MNKLHVSKNINPVPTISKIPNCLTVDVEDYFHVTGFADRVCRSDWDKYECRVEANTCRMLSIFEEAQVHGTFFILGWIADRYPRLVKRIADAGHEIACHGYWHQLIYDLTPEEFAKDISDSRDAIYNACGVEVTAYRAPSFSIVPRTRWALEILVEHGFTVDSSIFPIAGHDRYGDARAPRQIHQIDTFHGEITEFPPTAGFFKNKFPIPVGGGYFRMFPLGLTRSAIKQIRRDVGPAMFYIHPWELDPDQPRVKASRLNRFRHYVGLRRTASKLQRLLQSNEFAPLTEVIRLQASSRISEPKCRESSDFGTSPMDRPRTLVSSDSQSIDAIS